MIFQVTRSTKPWTTQHMRLNFSHFRPPRHVLKGESSVYYYLSDVAVPKILSANPTAKFIYMIRNPVDMIHSFHSQMCFNSAEDIPDFEMAWERQESRLNGFDIPKGCREPRLLQYRIVGQLGARLKSLRSIIPKKQLHVVVFDDLVANAKEMYGRVLDFLEISADNRCGFPVVNENKVARSRFLSRLSFSIPRPLHNAVREFKHLIGVSHIPFNVVAMINTRYARRPTLSQTCRNHLVSEFEPDVKLLEHYLKSRF